MVENEIKAYQTTYSTIRIEKRGLYSDYLERDVILDLYLPVNVLSLDNLPLLLVNDGQDLKTMRFGKILDALVSGQNVDPLICAAIYCSADRLMEYGTICRADYKGRGAKAGLYSKFIFDELLPFIRTELNISSFSEKSFAGFSMGGLSAMDIAWNHAHEFLKVGVFSGSLWWRRRGYDDEGYDYDKDRIMHLQVQKGTCYPWLRFFFECGQLDETADRNNNGIIDAIEDVTDLIGDLKGIGYTDESIRYLELPDGRHDVPTWARAFPEFLKWGWGK